MKNIVVNLKRFDIPKKDGGVFDGENNKKYASYILSDLISYFENHKDIKFTFFFQEAHLLEACTLVENVSNCVIGSQSVHFEDAEIGKNFGAFTSLTTAKAIQNLGCKATLIGHCEERRYLNGLYRLVDVNNQTVVNEILNKKIKHAVDQNLEVCYCIGEEDYQLNQWESVLLEQLEIGLKNIDCSKVIIGYEPLWSIGPGKTPADKDYIEKVVKLIKGFNPQLRVIYGGGVKQNNAKMLASIKVLDGGLIGLTNFTDNIGFHPNEFVEIVDLYKEGIE